jgi:hypothetical protein
MQQIPSNDKKVIFLARFSLAYVALMVLEVICYLVAIMQPAFKTSVLNTKSYCLTTFVILMCWQTLAIAALIPTPRRWWLPISKLNTIVWLFFFPLPAVIAFSPVIMLIYGNLSGFLSKFSSGYRPHY